MIIFNIFILYFVKCFLVRNVVIYFLFQPERFFVHVSVLPATMMLLAFKFGAFFKSFVNFHFSLVALDIGCL